MPQFIDSKGESWDVFINVNTARTCRQLLDFDLWSLCEHESFVNWIKDQILICDVMYCVCKKQADDRGVSDYAFGERMLGDAIDSAVLSMMEGVKLFSKDRKGGQATVKLFDTALKATDLQMENAESALPKVEKILDELLVKQFGDKSTEQQEFSE